jgi:hypothetical protein
MEDSVKEVDTSGLIDYVDFGREGNSFLKKVGVVSWPSACTIAEILLNRQAAYFKNSNENVEIRAKKMYAYLACLQRLAANVRELAASPLTPRLQTEPWCLGYELNEDKTKPTMRVFRIVSPKNIYLNDDNLSALKFHPLCAPNDQAVNNLYKVFGSDYLSKYVTTSADLIGMYIFKSTTTYCSKDT